jgi:DNA-binding transcriptional LysR family regulator
LPPNGWSAGSGGFAEAYPEIELKVSATMHHADFAHEDIDLAIRHGAGNWVGLDAVHLRGKAVSGLQSGFPQ